MSLMNKTGLYIHVPFCGSKCNYCDFNSYAGKLDLAEEYFACMKREIDLYRKEMAYNNIGTIFIGGGTPSCVEHRFMGEILNAARERYNISEQCEITIESNPGTITEEKLRAYRQYGINRLSIGLQAYQERLLKYLGRQHSSEDFVSSIKMAKDAGFNNINADVIFGIPGQTMEDWKETLNILADLDVTHISAYDLKIEEGTKFGDMQEAGKLIEMEDETDREMYHYAIDYLKKQGFKHYELSNFAREGCECRHNLIYWNCLEYLGLGAGAHSFLQDIRFENQASIEGYIDYLSKGDKPVEERFVRDFCEKMSEYMFLGLRLIEGVNKDTFKDRFNQELLETYASKVEKLKKLQLIEADRYGIRLTSLGLDLANQVFVEFV